ncbi:BamA/TamA family outer membrane protein [Ancylomarina sp.]|uniref:BamA/TamA family outer membrane protein n=1 Tax=Ancylomarina sp. TaxID=1970196 RepID=UPI0035683DC5
MTKYLLYLLLSLVSLNLFGNSGAPVADSTQLKHSIYFVGDMGEAPLVDANMQMLKKQLTYSGKKGTLVVLGNSISKENLRNDTDEEFDDKDLNKFLGFVKDFKGEVVFMPGDQEWTLNRKNGWESLKNFENYVEDFLDRGDVFLPSGGCPGPIEIELSDDIVLLIVDSQWWLHLGEKPEAECEFENTADFLIQLSDVFKRNENKKLILASHHPVYSGGNHAGYFPFPGPVELYRKFIGTPQDFASPYYKQMRHMAKKMTGKSPHLISVSAHDNSLQFKQVGDVFQVISGSGSQADYVNEKKMDFALREIGFSKLNFYVDGSVFLEFWTVGKQGDQEPRLALKKFLYQHQSISNEEIDKLHDQIDYSDSTITIAASQVYHTDSKSKLKLFGNNYRKEWETPINVPVFDIGKEKGGLKILKRGGGQQTRSLRLEAKDGRQYVLRSVEKYTEKAIPESLQKTFAAQIVQDGISESYPYAALAVPKMAEAAGVYHTHPKIVYVPDDPRLGIYQEGFKNELFLFEERPSGDWSDSEIFGGTKNILSTDKLLKKRYKNSKLVIDEEAVLRARIVDLLLNDWDRHDDQWRWASFEKGGKTIVRPIPRDRDQVFFYSDGKIPWLMRRKWLMPKFQVFDSIVENVSGLGFNSRYFDRSFLSSKTKEDWVEMANDLKDRLNDQVIEAAVSDLPSEVFSISGNNLISQLKARRDQLPEMAEAFYTFLAKEVDVVGTNENELYQAQWSEDGSLNVKVNSLSKKGKKGQLIFSRTFLPEETKEVRLFGLKGKDQFEIKGNAPKYAVKLNLIGGKGKDSFALENTRRNKVSIYDKVKTDINDAAFRNKTSNNSDANVYNRKAFKYDILSPVINANFVSEDGLILGAGLSYTSQAFKKEPFASQHKFLVNYAFRYPSFEIKYEGEINSIFRNIDFVGTIDYNSPNFQGYYYGLGNKTNNPQSDDKRYNSIRFEKILINPQARLKFNSEHQIKIGLFFEQSRLQETDNRFVTDFSDPMNDLDPVEDFSTRKYLGVNINYIWDSRNSIVLPSRGIYWQLGYQAFKGLERYDRDFNRYSSDLRMFFSFSPPARTVLAVRVGGAYNSDGYSVFQANKLGLKSNLRGYPLDRFAGDGIVYQNTDIRFRLSKFRSYLLAGEFGLLAFNDVGRVWISGEHSDSLYHGYGGGLWLSPFKLMVITANYSCSKEDKIFSLEFKYMF